MSNSYSEPEDSIVAKIWGIFVALYPREIRDLYGCLEIELPFLPHKSTDYIEMDDIVASVVGRNLTWGSLMFIPLGFLYLGHRVLVKIYHHCVRHEASKSMLSKADPLFIHGVGANKDIDLAQVLLNEIYTCFCKVKEGCTKSLTLVLGSLIFRILEKQGVPLIEGEKVLKCRDGTYRLSCLKKSISLAPAYTRANCDEEDEFILFQKNNIYSKGKNARDDKTRK